MLTTSAHNYLSNPTLDNVYLALSNRVRFILSRDSILLWRFHDKEMSCNTFIFTELKEWLVRVLTTIVGSQPLNLSAGFLLYHDLPFLECFKDFILSLQKVYPYIFEKSSIKVRKYLDPPFETTFKGPQTSE